MIGCAHHTARVERRKGEEDADDLRSPFRLLLIGEFALEHCEHAKSKQLVGIRPK
jgi:hypothetical protein